MRRFTIEKGIIRMAHQTDAPEETAAAEEAAPIAATPATDVQALIDEAVARFARQHGIDITPPAAPSALDALTQLASDAEHSTFAQKLEHLAENGYQAAVETEQESPLLKTLVSVVGELVEKAA